ncbi:hypothetical protein PFX98_04950 [Paucibacter sediminis]|uniref:Uncharacterized protein n=1 Tax=Paucibacter sediminis TaxID=3019553 RepID=A0AA95NID1_9BURK|nr:hypothetical protein [Paucibacter sp. S2-9]WIT12959.1 hypothetical protein PFX98_04950 [Paucibacter sp. S2-9]
MSTRFMTLLQREWMQHHRGWLLLILIPPLLVLLAMPFGRVETDASSAPTMAVAAVALGATALGGFGISWLVSMFQIPGLARRDQQDRSIEFWLSLPGTHTESIAATVLMHVVFVPLLALAISAGLGLVMAAAVVIKVSGLAALTEVSWLGLLIAGVVGVLRLGFGVLLMSLWLAPIYLGLMAASAWLKRWGAPLLIVATLIAGNVLNKVYDNPIVWKLLQAQADGAGRALMDAKKELERTVDGPASLPQFIGEISSWALHDALAALGQLASPHLIGGLAIAAACFGLLILHRRNAH